MARATPAGSAQTPRWLTLLIFSLAGAALGISGRDASFALLAWAGIAALAWALATARERWVSLAGLTVSAVLTRLLWLSWAWAMPAGLGMRDPREGLLVGAGFIAVATLPCLACLLLGATLFHARPGVSAWLPVAWAVSERLLARWTSVANDWLFTQVEVDAVMRALAWLGMWPTVLGCLFIAASAGEALARRKPTWALPGAALAMSSLLLPPVTSGDLAQLERVGVVHMRSEYEPPALDGLDRPLVVWPEASLALQPPVDEGPSAGVMLDAPLGGGPLTQHLVGLETRLHAGRQNVAAAVSPAGEITAVRAKRTLFPVFERRFLGRGTDRFLPGTRAPLLSAAGLQVIPLVCGEILTRELAAEGRAAGGTMVAVLASDRYQAGQELARHQVVSHVRLRAIEYGLPIVYASLGAQAFIVAADGRVLAESPRDAESGALTWNTASGARDMRAPARPQVAVLYSSQAPELRRDCPPGRCRYHALEGFRCPEVPSKTVILAGHGAPPTYAGHDVTVVADAIACFQPELVVIDSCFGASTSLLGALATRTDAYAVAAPSFVAERGLHYGPALFSDGTAAERALAVEVVPSAPLFRGRPNAEALAAAEARVASAEADWLRPRVRSWQPTLVLVEAAPGQEVLAPADWRKIGHPPAISMTSR